MFSAATKSDSGTCGAKFIFVSRKNQQHKGTCSPSLLCMHRCYCDRHRFTSRGSHVTSSGSRVSMGNGNRCTEAPHGAPTCSHPFGWETTNDALVQGPCARRRDPGESHAGCVFNVRNKHFLQTEKHYCTAPSGNDSSGALHEAYWARLQGPPPKKQKLFNIFPPARWVRLDLCGGWGTWFRHAHCA